MDLMFSDEETMRLAKGSQGYGAASQELILEGSDVAKLIGKVLKLLRLALTRGTARRSVKENVTVTNETHHPLFMDQFREYVETKLGESIDGLNNVLRSKFMSQFLAEKVLAPRNPIIPTVEENVIACGP
ncbi:MAG: hypothetical protein WBY44_22565 [Bryobacteraceae bacterium]